MFCKYHYYTKNIWHIWLCHCDQDASSPSGGSIPKLQDLVFRDGSHEMIGDITLVKGELLDVLAASQHIPE